MDEEKKVWEEYVHSGDIFLRNWDEYQRMRFIIMDYMGDADKIVDIGCGTGIISLALAESGKKVISLDYTPSMLKKARMMLEGEYDSPWFRGALEFYVGDAHSLGMPDNSKEGAIANNIIFAVEDPNKLLKEAYRVLADKGVFAVSGPRHCFDLERIDECVTSEFNRKGIYGYLKKHIDNFKCLQFKMQREGHIMNSYESSELSDILLETGFSRILERRDDMYYSQCYLVVAEK